MFRTFISLALFSLIFVVLGYVVVLLTEKPSEHADLDKIRPVLGSKHLGIILSAWGKTILVIGLFIAYVGGKAAIHEFFTPAKPDMPNIPNILELVQEVAEERFNHSYSNGYVIEQYPQQHLYEYRNYQRYTTWLSTQKDFKAFSEWLIGRQSSGEVKAELLRYMQTNCSNYSDVRELVSNLYSKFRAERNRRGNRNVNR